MNKRQKEVQQTFLDNEKKVLKKLEQNYKEALADIDDKIAILLGRDDKDLTNVIYQVEHQKALKTQVQSILEQLQNNEFETVSEYLANAYNDGFIGTMYDIEGQGIPLIVPIDQKQVVEAIQHETKLNNDLYTSMGKDVKKLQKNIASEISRGISTGLGYAEIARNIAFQTNVPKNNAMRIARTEAHRIQCKATLDAQYVAKEHGADVLKQWDSTLDGDTRKSHRKLDGQIRELDERFEVDGKEARFPGDFGDPAEDCNCRCAILQRARWALDEKELNTLKERAKFFGLDKTKDFEDYKKKYLNALEKTSKSSTMKSLDAPIINNPKIQKAKEKFDNKLLNSKGIESHVSRMILYSDNTEYVLDENSSAAFHYLPDMDVIAYNPEAPNFDLYDIDYVQAHELSHRMDVLEYNSFNNSKFIEAIDICKKKVKDNAIEIQQWFEDGGKYESNFAVSDIISALSNNSISVPIGHNNEYWEDDENVALEVFANISAIDILDDVAKDEFNLLLKELFEAYRGIVE